MEVRDYANLNRYTFWARRSMAWWRKEGSAHYGDCEIRKVQWRTPRTPPQTVSLVSQTKVILKVKKKKKSYNHRDGRWCRWGFNDWSRQSPRNVGHHVLETLRPILLLHGKTREMLRLKGVGGWDHWLRLIRWRRGYRGTEVSCRLLCWLGLRYDRCRTGRRVRWWGLRSSRSRVPRMRTRVL